MTSLKHWFGRFSFSFIILAALCFWTAHKDVQAHGWGGKPVLLMAGGVTSLIAGLIGVRLRHSSGQFKDSQDSVR